MCKLSSSRYCKRAQFFVEMCFNRLSFDFNKLIFLCWSLKCLTLLLCFLDIIKTQQHKRVYFTYFSTYMKVQTRFELRWMDAVGRMLAVGEALEEWRCELVAGYLYPPLLTFCGFGHKSNLQIVNKSTKCQQWGV